MIAKSVLPPQITVKATLLSIVLSAVLAGANAYLGLFAGLTVAASIPAAVISMAVLRLFAESNILENNIVQTSASAGEALAAGVIFTLPALVILGYWNTFDYLWVSVIALVGGMLGVLFTIPLRRSLIVEQQLAFPEATATAEVLKLGEASSRGVRYLAWAAAIGGAVKLAETGLRLWSGTAQAATYVGSSTILYVGTNLSPALISVGYIVGLNIAVLVFAGGAISWYLAIPIYSAFFIDGDRELAAQLASGTPAADLAFSIWNLRIRYLGVGAMLVGGIWALIEMRASLWSGIRSGFRRPSRSAADYDHTEHDTPMQIVLAGIALLVIPIFALYEAIVGSLGIALAMTLIMVVAGFLFSAVGAYLAGVVGSSNSPISGITIATILFASLLLLFLMGEGAAAGPPAAIMIGAVVCCAAAIGGDNLQDLKAGYIVGATPWRQQLMQLVGVVAAVLVMAPILNLLLAAYGIGPPTDERPNSLLAPQATLMASVAQGVFGGGLPWDMIGWGALIGIVIIGVDQYLRRRGALWRAPVLAVAVGIYLPLELAVPILAGGLIAHFAASKHSPDREGRLRNGMLFAAGLITGEALIGILMAIPIVLSANPDVIALPVSLPSVGGLLVVGAVAVALYRVATGGFDR
ncbi:MAG TPA: oligopeptide transporter, OPT family [Gammaproteobacteria bacterium]|nr:oligopeptide transporter, OPT family [Gammaproteobacteria bacterium]